MKAKLKSANGIVRFLLNHGEKLGMAAVLAVAGLLIYRSLGRETLGEDKQPQQLDAAVVASQKSVLEDMNWDKLPPEQQTSAERFMAQSGEIAITPVRSADFPRIILDQPVIEPMKLRDDPVLVAVENLEVNPGAGLWMSANPDVIREKMIEAQKEAEREAQEAKELAEREAAEAEEGEGRRRRGRDRDREGMMGRGEGYSDYGGMGGTKTKDGAIVVNPRGGAEMIGFEDIRERSWVTVLAKVPIGQQFQMYEDALAGAGGFDPTKDQPNFMAYQVQRAEITEAGQGEWKSLPTVFDHGIIKVMDTWPIQTPDLVTPKYIHPLLSFPLPPMVMREWGDEITHSELPIQTPEEIMEEEMRAQEEALQPEEEEEEAIDPDDPFAGVIRRQRRAQAAAATSAYGGEGGMYRGGGRGEGGMYRGGEGGMYRGGGRGEGGEGGMYRGGGGMTVTQLPQYTWDGETKYLLFRYFDSTVTPGHRYRYRVRLAMVDVNAEVNPKFLAPEVTTRLEAERQAAVKAGKSAKPRGLRTSEWSEPSPVAVVPQPGLIYLAGAEPPSQSNVNAEPEARLVIKSLDSVNAAEVAVGDVFLRGSVLNLSRQAEIIWSSLFEVDPAAPEPSPVFDFITGLTLVDFDGGDELTPKNRKLLAPARAIVMDSSGRLRLRNELEDEKTVREYDLIMKASEEAARRERERGNERRGGREGRGA